MIVALSRHQDEGNSAQLFLDPVEELGATVAPEVEVAEHDVGLLPLNHLDRPRDRSDSRHIPTQLDETRAQGIEHHLPIVHDQDRGPPNGRQRGLVGGFGGMRGQQVRFSWRFSASETQAVK